MERTASGDHDHIPSIVVGSRGNALNPFKYSESWLAGSVGVNMAWNGTTSRQGTTLRSNPTCRKRLNFEIFSSGGILKLHSPSISSENLCPWLIIPRMSDGDSVFSFLFTSCFIQYVNPIDFVIGAYRNFLKTIHAPGRPVFGRGLDYSKNRP